MCFEQQQPVQYYVDVLNGGSRSDSEDVVMKPIPDLDSKLKTRSGHFV